MFSAAILSFFAIAASAAPAAQLTAVAGTVVSTTNSVTSALGVTVAPASIDAQCDTTSWQCTGTVSGGITAILVDGKSYSGQTSLMGWCGISSGCAGFSHNTGTGYAPLNLTCNSASGACTGNFGGSVNAIFSNGQAITEWGIGTVSGSCVNGNCTGFLDASGDPTY